MTYIDFLSVLHKKTKRNYLARVNEFPKAKAARVAKQFGYDYWDGARKYGYGGYQYDGRWRIVAENLVQYYKLMPGDRILDIGCGKAFLLYEFTQVVPGIKIHGVDVSKYAIENAKLEAKINLQLASAAALPYADQSFDLVISITTLHNLCCYDLELSLCEIERVGKKHKYVVMESYRTEEEKANLLYWQLTCESFYTPKEWKWWFSRCNYTGDYSLIFFE